MRWNLKIKSQSPTFLHKEGKKISSKSSSWRSWEGNCWQCLLALEHAWEGSWSQSGSSLLPPCLLLQRLGFAPICCHSSLCSSEGLWQYLKGEIWRKVWRGNPGLFFLLSFPDNKHEKIVTTVISWSGEHCRGTGSPFATMRTQNQ